MELTDGQAQQTSGEDFSGDWGERHDGELGAEGQAQQTSGEPDAAQEQPVQYTDLPLDAEGYPSNNRHSARKSAVKQNNCAVDGILQKDSVKCY